jgi:hypothetical protein
MIIILFLQTNKQTKSFLRESNLLNIFGLASSLQEISSSGKTGRADVLVLG